MTNTESLYSTLAKAVMSRYAIEHNFDFYTDYILPDSFLKENKLPDYPKRANFIFVEGNQPYIIFFKKRPKTTPRINFVFYFNPDRFGSIHPYIEDFNDSIYEYLDAIRGVLSERKKEKAGK